MIHNKMLYTLHTNRVKLNYLSYQLRLGFQTDENKFIKHINLQTILTVKNKVPARSYLHIVSHIILTKS